MDQLPAGASKRYAKCLLNAVKAALSSVLGYVAGAVIVANIAVFTAETVAVNATIAAKRWTRLPKMKKFKTKW